MAEITPKDSNNRRWIACFLSQIFDIQAFERLLEDITSQNEVKFTDEKSIPVKPYEFPDPLSNRLSAATLPHIAQDLSHSIFRAVSSVAETPAVMLFKRQSIVWRRVVSAQEHHTYSESNLKCLLAEVVRPGLEAERDIPDTKKKKRKYSDATEPLESPEKRTANDILVELGVKTGLTVVFALLKQSWSQLLWERALEQQLLPSGPSLRPPSQPQPSLPNEVLRSVLLVLKSIPPLSLSNGKSLSKLGNSCLEQSMEFLYSLIQANSCVDREGKRLACEILLHLVLQQGTLVGVLGWMERVLTCLAGYCHAGQKDPCVLSMEACLGAVEEIRHRTKLHGAVIHRSRRPFAPKERSPEGHVLLFDFLIHLCDEISCISADCTRCFSEEMSADSVDSPFASETCDVFAFGSNSSGQLAMGSTEKFVKATLMPHMANCQLAEAGQYCTFVVFSDGMMKGCGKGSYGRLGLGTSDSEPTLKPVSTFPAGTVIRKVSSSRGSDGHSLAITAKGELYSWGEGNYGKLGHGDHITQKVPKLIEALSQKVVRQVACGNRHSAAITADGELYTWGEGDYGRLGHGSTVSVKVPTKVSTIDLAQQVACGAAHTLVLSMDGLTVWSFGSGDLGKLGHGDTNRQIVPKVIEGLRGVVCQKVCAGSQFSLVLTAGGKVYSFGNGSGVGKGTTEPRQSTPWLIDSLEGEVIIDIATGDGHCLALTQRGEVYAWGTNSMGQCGQGHSNGSVTVPSKVVGLEGVQIQQISAGTSHSLVWTAVPLDRRASSLWHWPYCVSVGEDTYCLLLSILNQYGGLHPSEPVAPFNCKQAQESFVHSMMSLLCTHLKLSAPLGSSCVHVACGNQVKNIRSFLFKLIDSNLPQAIDQVTTEALVVGTPILVPPVLERVELLLEILPKEPSNFSSLTSGQRRQIDLLLAGLDEGSEIAGLIVDAEWLDYDSDVPNHWVCSKHIGKLFALRELAAQYIFEATIHSLEVTTTSLPEAVQLGSYLLKRFERLVASVYCHVVTFMSTFLEWAEKSDQLLLPLSDRKAILIHFEPFFHILNDLSLHVLSTIVKNCYQSPDPLTYLRAHKGVQFGFLAYQFPGHVALTTDIVPAFDVIFNVGELLLKVADVVHQLLLLLPSDVVQECEKRELHWEPVYLKPEKLHASLFKLREGEGEVNQWQTWMDYERLLCWSASQCAHYLYCSELVHNKETEVLHYSVGKDRLTLISSGLVRNGAVSGMTHALYNWVSLCKTIYQINDEDDCKGLSDCWTDYLDEYRRLKDRSPAVQDAQLDLFLDPDMIGPCDPSVTIPLFALAVGASGNHQAERVYEKMMDFARKRDWNTWSDEGSLPQLKQTSCAALACCLHHCGLLSYAVNCKTSPKKELVMVYRAVFALRREVFIHRPLTNSEGIIDPAEQKRFEEMCRGICFTLFFLICVLSPAFPEEPNVDEDQVIADDTTTTSHSSDDLGTGNHNKLPSHSDAGGHEEETNSDLLSASSSELFDWSQPSVKQAWSLLSLKKQKDRKDAPHISILSPTQNPTKKVAWTIVELVCQIFKDSATLLSREGLVHVLACHYRRATDRRDALKKVALFLEKADNNNALLLSSQLIYLFNCLNHSFHYSHNISVATGELQKEIETLYHFVLHKIVARVQSVKPSDIKGSSNLALVRQLLLVLQWTSFQHNPNDIHMLFDGDFLSKMMTFSGVVTPTSCAALALDSRLCTTLQQVCEQLIKLLALRVGITAGDLKIQSGILNKISAVIYGQLEGYVNCSDSHIVEQWHAKGMCAEQREMQLGGFLCFLGTLLASGGHLCAAMATERLTSMLLKVMGTDSSGDQLLVCSLKTRLLALQVLEMIVCGPFEEGFMDLSKCVEIVETLLELMYRSAVTCPVLLYQEGLLQMQKAGAEADREVPCLIDPSWQHNCSIAIEGETAVVTQDNVPGYAIGQFPLASGRYTWKVSAETTKASFFVGVALKHLTSKGIQSSNDVWVLDAASGHLYHGGEKGDTQFVASEGGDTITVQFDSVAKTLSFGKNDEPLEVAFQEISKPGEELFPALFFNKKNATTRVRLHPILKETKVFVSSIRQREHLVSGFPLLSSSGVTLTQSAMNLLYKLQEKQPWAEAIGLALHRSLEELGPICQSFSTFKSRCSSGSDSDPQRLLFLSNILSQALQTLWPCLTLIGGMETGLYLGRECQVVKEDVQESVTVVSIPNAQQEVMVQEQVANSVLQVPKRVAVVDLKLSNQRKFLLSLIAPWLTPSMVMDIANLSGILVDSCCIPTISTSAHPSLPLHSSVLPAISSSPFYLKLCHSILQLSATKCLHSLLFDEGIIPILLDHTPSHTLVDHTTSHPLVDHFSSHHFVDCSQQENSSDHKTIPQSTGLHQACVSEQGQSREGRTMTSVLRAIVGHLAQRSVQPSLLKPALNMAELDRLHSVLAVETLRTVAEYLRGVSCDNDTSLLSEASPSQSVPSLPSQSIPPPSPIVHESLPDDPNQRQSGEHHSNILGSPPVLNTLANMGFPISHIRIALERCILPEETSPQAQIEMLVSWIVDHSHLLGIVEEGFEQEMDEQVGRVECAQSRTGLTGNRLITELLDSEGDGAVSNLKHAPDLLEGPSLDDRGINIINLDEPYTERLSGTSTLESLLTGRIPDCVKFSFSDPLGESTCQVQLASADSCAGGRKEDTSDGFTAAQPLCSALVAQAQDLRSPEGCVVALHRVTSALQTAVARRVVTFVLCALSVYPREEFLANLGILKLNSPSFLVGLLRLAHAGRIDGTRGTQFSIQLRTSFQPVLAVECLCAAIKTISSSEPVIVQSGPQATKKHVHSPGGHRFVQTCCRDLVVAAVGGVDVSVTKRMSSGKSVDTLEMTILSCPSFSVSQSLVQGMIDTAVSTDPRGAEITCLADALAACILSSKLQQEHRVWALKQLLRLLSAVKKEEQGDMCKEEAISPSSLEHLIGHKAQIIACVQIGKGKILSIANDTAVLWDVSSGLKHPVVTTLSLPEGSTAQMCSCPVLTTKNLLQTCAVTAVNQTLCVIRSEGEPMTTVKLPDRITALEWKRGQGEGESLTVLVGLASGQLVLANVMNSEILVTFLEHTFKEAVCGLSWSPSGHHFVVASACGLHVYSQPSTLNGVPTVLCSEGFEVTKVDWSPAEGVVASVERKSSALQIWDISLGHLVSIYQSSDLCVTQLSWYPTVRKDGPILLVGGSETGSIYLWRVDCVRYTLDHGAGRKPARVCLVVTLDGHSSPITSLVFGASGTLLASGCQAGYVRVWDMMTSDVLKSVTNSGCGTVVNLCWTDTGLAICYKNTNTLHLLPPGPQDYLGERSIHYAFPTLSRYGISQLDKTPCLAALLRASLQIVADQHRYESMEIASGSQITHSEYLQSLIALVIGLNLHLAVVLSLHSAHLPPDLSPIEWQWLDKLTLAVAMAHSLTKRTSLPSNADLSFLQRLQPTSPYRPMDNSTWTAKMDADIVQWVAERPQDWWQVQGSAVYTWGRGTAHQLGHSTAESTPPGRAVQWEEDMRLVVAGNLCTYGVKFDGSVWSVGEGLNERLGHGGTARETNMRLIGALQGIPVVYVVAGPRISVSVAEGFALALTSTGEVYSWGKGCGGRLGHPTSEDICTPRRIESLVGKDIKMIAACDRHCSALTTSGQLYLFGASDHGQLGQGHTLTNQLDNPVVQVTHFLDSDERTPLDNVIIGYVCCGQQYTIAISESGSEVFACGSSDCGSFGSLVMSGDHHYPYLLSHLTQFGPFVKCAAGLSVTALLNVRGQVCVFGKLCSGVPERAPELLAFPGEEEVIDMQLACDYMLLLTKSGNVYSVGRNAPGTRLLGYETTTVQVTPKVIESLSGKHIKQISAGPTHASASNVPCAHSQRGAAMCLVPLSIPMQYSSLKGVPCEVVHSRYSVLSQFSHLILSSWRLFSVSVCSSTSLDINPLAESNMRLLISPNRSRSMFEAVINRTMSTKARGPAITINRTIHGIHPRPVFPQIATQIIQKPSSDLRCASRAWKVSLIGEAADDAGGVFDETIAQMCEELQSGTLDLLIPTPNARNKCGFNTDRFVFNPRCTSSKMLSYFKFVGIMLGVAIRTRKPLALHLAQPIWKLLAGMTLTTEDLEEMDLMFVRTMFSIKGMHVTGIIEEEFSELIPIEFFEAEDMNGHFVPIVPGGGHIRLTFHNREEYVEKAIHFRLHELDQQVAAVREGMASIVPVPLLSLYTARMLEVSVCGSEQIDIHILKKVASYGDGISENDEIIKWLWQTLDSFTNEEKVLFLRFVSGRSRLPARVSEITQRFKILKGGETPDALPTAQTCFFQIRLPVYRSQQVMTERLRYAIRNCRSIDMDNYMLRRTGEWENDEEL